MYGKNLHNSPEKNGPKIHISIIIYNIYYFYKFWLIIWKLKEAILFKISIPRRDFFVTFWDYTYMIAKIHRNFYSRLGNITIFFSGLLCKPVFFACQCVWCHNFSLKFFRVSVRAVCNWDLKNFCSSFIIKENYNKNSCNRCPTIRKNCYKTSHHFHTKKIKKIYTSMQDLSLKIWLFLQS